MRETAVYLLKGLGGEVRRDFANLKDDVGDRKILGTMKALERHVASYGLRNEANLSSTYILNVLVAGLYERDALSNVPYESCY